MPARTVHSPAVGLPLRGRMLNCAITAAATASHWDGVNWSPLAASIHHQYVIGPKESKNAAEIMSCYETEENMNCCVLSLPK
jgi:hypothetical protein